VGSRVEGAASVGQHVGSVGTETATRETVAGSGGIDAETVAETDFRDRDDFGGGGRALSTRVSTTDVLEIDR
jgi:hypothetical protein